MKVAIVFIGTSKYINFFSNYYKYAQENFLPGVEKTFLVFTDQDVQLPENCVVYKEQHREWPFITLTRFEIINKAREEILKHDWLVFLDADTVVVDKVTEEEFISTKPLFGVWHPCHYLKMSGHEQLPGSLETNELSLAYVDVNKYNPSVYYQGCMWGGRIPEVLHMIDELEMNTNTDLQQNIIARWHDESHLNRYLIEHNDQVKTFGPGYAYPEVFASMCTFKPKIVHVAKDNSNYHI